MTALETRAPKNVLIVEMANKLARIAWAVLSSGQEYRAFPNTVAALARAGSTINEFSHQGLHRAIEDERTVTTAYVKPVLR